MEVGERWIDEVQLRVLSIGLDRVIFKRDDVCDGDVVFAHALELRNIVEVLIDTPLGLYRDVQAELLRSNSMDGILEEVSGKTEGDEFGVAVNPEFQSQGSAIENFMNANKIVIGIDGDDQALTLLRDFYAPLIDEDTSLVETGRREEAMIKYASNVFLASKISLVNELGNICKEYDVDAYEVIGATGLDERISAPFLRSGVGYGDSCFPKDTDALIAAARAVDY